MKFCNLQKAVARIANCKPVYIEFNDGAQRRERIVKIERHRDGYISFLTINDERIERIAHNAVVFTHD